MTSSNIFKSVAPRLIFTLDWTGHNHLFLFGAICPGFLCRKTGKHSEFVPQSFLILLRKTFELILPPAGLNIKKFKKEKVTTCTPPHDPHHYHYNSALYSTVSICEAKHSTWNLILNEMQRRQQIVPLAFSVSYSSRTRRTDAICCDLPRDARMRVGFYCLKLFPLIPLSPSSSSLLRLLSLWAASRTAKQ